MADGTSSSEEAHRYELRKATERIAELEARLEHDMATHAEHESIEHALRERVKELNCLYRITEAVDRFGDSLDELLQRISDGLPASWQYPEITCARIVFAEREYATPNFQVSQWRQTAGIRVSGDSAGTVEVHYTAEMPSLDEGPFLKEERLLIDAVAERVGRIIERIQAKRQLQVERTALQQANVAMHELMARINEEKAAIGRAVQANVDKIAMPIVDALEETASVQQKRYLQLLRRNLEEIASPFVDRITDAFVSLTPAEIRVCNMIRRGLTTKEIARLQGISPSTVGRHREHIREKLGLTNRKANLVTYLNAMGKKSVSPPEPGLSQTQPRASSEDSLGATE